MSMSMCWWPWCRCSGCDERMAVGEAGAFCTACAGAIEKGGAPRWIDGLRVWAPYGYGGPVREAILRSKAAGGAGAAELLGEVARWASRQADLRRAATADTRVVAIAPHRGRLRERLGHLPDRLAARVVRGLELTPLPAALARVDSEQTRGDGGHAPPVFVAGAGLRDGIRALLVDDVVTTGLTLATAAAVLRRAGVRVVGALVIADARSDWALRR